MPILHYYKRHIFAQLFVIQRYAIVVYGEEDTEIHVFLSSALVGGEWWALGFAALP
jgi:hypothetical protein